MTEAFDLLRVELGHSTREEAEAHLKLVQHADPYHAAQYQVYSVSEKMQLE